MLRVFVVGLLGGAGSAFLVLATIILYVETFDPTGGEGHRDPMSGLATFYYLVAVTFVAGACFAIAADVALRRWWSRGNVFRGSRGSNRREAP